MNNVFTIHGSVYHIKDIKEIDKITTSEEKDYEKCKLFDMFRDPSKVHVIYRSKFNIYMGNGIGKLTFFSNQTKGFRNTTYLYDLDLSDARDLLIEKWNNYNFKNA